MTRIILACVVVLLAACKSNTPFVQPQHRLIYNNDGTEILGSNWFGKRPLTLADVNQYVDMVAGSQVITFMICSGSDFFYYRSKFGNIIGDDKSGVLNCGDNIEGYQSLNRLYQSQCCWRKRPEQILLKLL